MNSLKELMLGAFPDYSNPASLPSTQIQGIETDSRKVAKNFIFVAINGVKGNGNAFIGDAIWRGAAAVVSSQQAPERLRDIPYLWVPDSRDAAARLAGAFYGYPARGMTVVGITGTNGKTTSSFIVEHILRQNQKKAGLIGTIQYRFGDRSMEAVETTPGPLRLQELLSQMRQVGCEYAVMEVSAHALDQKRVAGIDFHTALFTNLTQDHLDYFTSFKNYFEAKARLFSGLSAHRCAVLNVDDPWGVKLKTRTKSRVITFGVQQEADFKAGGLVQKNDRTSFSLRVRGRKIKIYSPLIGLHNVYNVVGALAVCATLGFEVEKSAEALLSFQGVPGRLERVERGQDFLVFVDYAHTPDGLQNALSTLLGHKKNKLFLVFGCGGERDADKRPQMAAIASRFCDFVYVTSDNPRSEDPERIARDICDGFPADFKAYRVVLNREMAVRQALLSASHEDIVLLAGKGHENTQVIGGQALPYSDRQQAEKILDGH